MIQLSYDQLEGKILDEAKQLISDGPIDDLYFESRIVNVLNKTASDAYIDLQNYYGTENIHDNGFAPRTKHEIYSGLKCVERRGIITDTTIYNLPFTVSKGARLAETAFVDRPLERRNIYLVPDHTETRIKLDISYHTEGYLRLVENKELSQEKATEYIEYMNTYLTVGERVAATLIHEYGHILSFRILDTLGITERINLYDWFDEYGYLDNVSVRIVSFSQEHPDRKINICMEQLAEDYRVSHDVKNSNDMCCLPHIISFEQDIINPDKFLEGAVIMSNLLSLKGKSKGEKFSQKEKSSIDRVIPFGEANRSSVPTSFRHGEITPITEADKKRDRELLKS